MNEQRPGRRHALSGSLAVALTTTLGISNGNSIAHSTFSGQNLELEQKDVSPSPFQKAFLTWFHEEPTRFNLPVSVGAVTSTSIEVRIHGIHPAIYISVRDHSEINIHVEWEGVRWDQLLWLFADEEPGPGGVGWVDDSVFPECRPVVSWGVV